MNRNALGSTVETIKDFEVLDDLGKDLKGVVTHCIRCGGTLFWDHGALPHVMKLGNNHVLNCLETGCKLVVTDLINGILLNRPAAAC